MLRAESGRVLTVIPRVLRDVQGIIEFAPQPERPADAEPGADDVQRRSRPSPRWRISAKATLDTVLVPCCSHSRGRGRGPGWTAAAASGRPWGRSLRSSRIRLSASSSRAAAKLPLARRSAPKPVRSDNVVGSSSPSTHAGPGERLLRHLVGLGITAHQPLDVAQVTLGPQDVLVVGPGVGGPLLDEPLRQRQRGRVVAGLIEVPDDAAREAPDCELAGLGAARWPPR